jgi:probable HAF family extracellular repeat protein
MQHYAHRAVALGILALSLATLPLHAAMLYHVTDVNESSPPGGRGFGINELGQLTGTAISQAYLWNPDTPNSTSGSITFLGGLNRSRYAVGGAINDLGRVAGVSAVTGGIDAGVWAPSVPNGDTGAWTDLGRKTILQVPDLNMGINNFDQIVESPYVGEAAINAPQHAVLWTPTSSTTWSTVDLGDFPGGLDFSVAAGINDYGQVVGTGSTAAGGRLDRGFLWQPNSPRASTGTIIPFDQFGATSAARTINSLGHVVVDSSSGPFLWTPSSPNDITGSSIHLGQLPSHLNWIPTDLNDRDEVVGYAVVGEFETRSVFWSPSTGVIDLSKQLDASGAGWTVTLASGINNAGQIVGSAERLDSGGTPMVYSVLLTPVTVPEPTAALWGLIFAVSMFYRNRGRIRRLG